MSADSGWRWPHCCGALGLPQRLYGCVFAAMAAIATSHGRDVADSNHKAEAIHDKLQDCVCAVRQVLKQKIVKEANHKLSILIIINIDIILKVLLFLLFSAPHAPSSNHCGKRMASFESTPFEN